MTKVTEKELKQLIRNVVTPHIDTVVDPIVRCEVNKLYNPTDYHGQLFKQKDTPGGDAFGAVLQAVANSQGDHNYVRGVATDHGYGNCIKALAAGDLAAGGVFIESDLASEVIELLRPVSAVRRIGPRSIRVPHGTKEFPKIESSASAAYVEENSDISSSEPTTGSVVMTAKKLAALVPISNELLAWGSVDAQREIRDDTVMALAQEEDNNLLRGDGLVSGPKGLRYWAAASNVTATNGTSAANIETDFKELLEDLEGNNVKMRRPAWIMASRSKNHLLTLRDANGNLIYPELRSSSPTIFTWPVIVSNTVPTNLGGGANETELYLVDADEVLLGEVESVRVEVSREASYLDSAGTLRSAWSRDQTVLRIILQHDLAMRHDVGVAVKTGITWGA